MAVRNYLQRFVGYEPSNITKTIRGLKAAIRKQEERAKKAEKARDAEIKTRQAIEKKYWSNARKLERLVRDSY